MYVSPSQLAMFARCGQQYRYRYLEGLVRPPGVALLVGRAVDESVTANLEARILGGEALAEQDAEAVAADAIAVAFSEEVDTGGIAKAQAAATSCDQATALALLHHRRVAPKLRPIGVQERVEYAVRPGLALMGFIDVREVGRIRDTKTTTKAPPRGIAERSVQLTVYAAAAGVTEVALDYLIAKKVPEAESITARRGPEDLEPVLARAEALVIARETGSFAPADPESWWCSKSWCGYWDRCPYAVRPAAVVVPSLF